MLMHVSYRKYKVINITGKVSLDEALKRTGNYPATDLDLSVNSFNVPHTADLREIELLSGDSVIIRFPQYKESEEDSCK